MLDMLSPGVYPVEVDFSAYVRSLSTSTAGFVGTFEKGTIGQAVLVTSLADAQAKFGTYVDGLEGMFALKAFFENGGSRAYVVRTAHYTAGALATAEKSTITLEDRAGTPLDTIRVDAINEGTWADGIQITVQASAGLAATGFTLVVKNAAGTVLETFKDLLVGAGNAASADYLTKKINGISEYITVTDLASATAAENNRPALGTFTLAGGDDGLTSLAAVDFVGSEAYGNGLYAFDSVKPNFIAVPGETSATVANGLVTYAAARTDLIAILEVPQGSTVSAMETFRESTITADSSYAALYGPWLTSEHPLTGATINTPPSGVVAGIFARNDQEGAVWTAPAGLNRATVRGVIEAERRLSKTDRDTLYEAGINPICVVANTLCVYGQKTLQLKASATDRINVRRLMIHIEDAITDSGQFLVFEPNIKKTWEAFKRLVNPFLQRIKDGGGFYDFLTVCDASINTASVIDANQMKARVYVKPTKTAEFIPIEFAIAGTGADFSTL
jgi:uncharacterized protein